MPLREPIIGDVKALQVECGDCGRERWLARHALLKSRITPETSIENLSARFRCSSCLEAGLPGTNIIVTPVFHDAGRARSAELFALNNLATRESV